MASQYNSSHSQPQQHSSSSTAGIAPSGATIEQAAAMLFSPTTHNTDRRAVEEWCQARLQTAEAIPLLLGHLLGQRGEGAPPVWGWGAASEQQQYHQQQYMYQAAPASAEGLFLAAIIIKKTLHDDWPSFTRLTEATQYESLLSLLLHQFLLGRCLRPAHTQQQQEHHPSSPPPPPRYVVNEVMEVLTFLLKEGLIEYERVVVPFVRDQLCGMLGLVWDLNTANTCPTASSSSAAAATSVSGVVGGCDAGDDEAAMSPAATRGGGGAPKSTSAVAATSSSSASSPSYASLSGVSHSVVYSLSTRAEVTGAVALLASLLTNLVESFALLNTRTPGRTAHQHRRAATLFKGQLLDTVFGVAMRLVERSVVAAVAPPAVAENLVRLLEQQPERYPLPAGGHFAGDFGSGHGGGGGGAPLSLEAQICSAVDLRSNSAVIGALLGLDSSLTFAEACIMGQSLVGGGMGSGGGSKRSARRFHPSNIGGNRNADFIYGRALTPAPPREGHHHQHHGGGGGGGGPSSRGGGGGGYVDSFNTAFVGSPTRFPLSQDRPFPPSLDASFSSSSLHGGANTNTNAGIGHGSYGQQQQQQLYTYANEQSNGTTTVAAVVPIRSSMGGGSRSVPFPSSSAAVGVSPSPHQIRRGGVGGGGGGNFATPMHQQFSSSSQQYGNGGGNGGGCDDADSAGRSLFIDGVSPLGNGGGASGAPSPNSHSIILAARGLSPFFGSGSSAAAGRTRIRGEGEEATVSLFGNSPATSSSVAGNNANGNSSANNASAAAGSDDPTDVVELNNGRHMLSEGDCDLLARIDWAQQCAFVNTIATTPATVKASLALFHSVLGFDFQCLTPHARHSVPSGVGGSVRIYGTGANMGAGSGSSGSGGGGGIFSNLKGGPGEVRLGGFPSSSSLSGGGGGGGSSSPTSPSPYATGGVGGLSGGGGGSDSLPGADPETLHFPSAWAATLLDSNIFGALLTLFSGRLLTASALADAMANAAADGGHHHHHHGNGGAPFGGGGDAADDASGGLPPPLNRSGTLGPSSYPASADGSFSGGQHAPAFSSSSHNNSANNTMLMCSHNGLSSAGAPGVGGGYAIDPHAGAVGNNITNHQNPHSPPPQPHVNNSLEGLASYRGDEGIYLTALATLTQLTCARRSLFDSEDDRAMWLRQALGATLYIARHGDGSAGGGGCFAVGDPSLTPFVAALRRYGGDSQVVSVMFEGAAGIRAVGEGQAGGGAVRTGASQCPFVGPQASAHSSRDASSAALPFNVSTTAAATSVFGPSSAAPLLLTTDHQGGDGMMGYSTEASGGGGRGGSLLLPLRPAPVSEFLDLSRPSLLARFRASSAEGGTSSAAVANTADGRLHACQSAKASPVPATAASSHLISRSSHDPNALAEFCRLLHRVKPNFHLNELTRQGRLYRLWAYCSAAFTVDALLHWRGRPDGHRATPHEQGQYTAQLYRNFYGTMLELGAVGGAPAILSGEACVDDANNGNEGGSGANSGCSNSIAPRPHLLFAYGADWCHAAAERYIHQCQQQVMQTTNTTMLMMGASASCGSSASLPSAINGGGGDTPQQQQQQTPAPPLLSAMPPFLAAALTTTAGPPLPTSDGVPPLVPPSDDPLCGHPFASSSPLLAAALGFGGSAGASSASSGNGGQQGNGGKKGPTPPLPRIDPFANPFLTVFCPTVPPPGAGGRGALEEHFLLPLRHYHHEALEKQQQSSSSSVGGGGTSSSGAAAATFPSVVASLGRAPLPLAAVRQVLGFVYRGAGATEVAAMAHYAAAHTNTTNNGTNNADAATPYTSADTLLPSFLSTSALAAGCNNSNSNSHHQQQNSFSASASASSSLFPSSSPFPLSAFPAAAAAFFATAAEYPTLDTAAIARSFPALNDRCGTYDIATLSLCAAWHRMAASTTYASAEASPFLSEVLPAIVLAFFFTRGGVAGATAEASDAMRSAEERRRQKQREREGKQQEVSGGSVGVGCGVGVGGGTLVGSGSGGAGTSSHIGSGEGAEAFHNNDTNNGGSAASSSSSAVASFPDNGPLPPEEDEELLFLQSRFVSTLVRHCYADGCVGPFLGSILRRCVDAYSASVDASAASAAARLRAARCSEATALRLTAPTGDDYHAEQYRRWEQIQNATGGSHHQSADSSSSSSAAAAAAIASSGGGEEDESLICTSAAFQIAHLLYFFASMLRNRSVAVPSSMVGGGGGGSTQAAKALAAVSSALLNPFAPANNNGNGSGGGGSAHHTHHGGNNSHSGLAPNSAQNINAYLRGCGNSSSGVTSPIASSIPTSLIGGGGGGGHFTMEFPSASAATAAAGTPGHFSAVAPPLLPFAAGPIPPAALRALATAAHSFYSLQSQNQQLQQQLQQQQQQQYQYHQHHNSSAGGNSSSGAAPISAAAAANIAISIGTNRHHSSPSASAAAVLLSPTEAAAAYDAQIVATVFEFLSASGRRAEGALGAAANSLGTVGGVGVGASSSGASPSSSPFGNVFAPTSFSFASSFGLGGDGGGGAFHKQKYGGNTHHQLPPPPPPIPFACEGSALRSVESAALAFLHSFRAIYLGPNAVVSPTGGGAAAGASSSSSALHVASTSHYYGSGGVGYTAHRTVSSDGGAGSGGGIGGGGGGGGKVISLPLTLDFVGRLLCDAAVSAAAGVASAAAAGNGDASSAQTNSAGSEVSACGAALIGDYTALVGALSPLLLPTAQQPSFQGSASSSPSSNLVGVMTLADVAANTQRHLANITMDRAARCLHLWCGYCGGGGGAATVAGSTAASLPFYASAFMHAYPPQQGGGGASASLASPLESHGGGGSSEESTAHDGGCSNGNNGSRQRFAESQPILLSTLALFLDMVSGGNVAISGGGVGPPAAAAVGGNSHGASSASVGGAPSSSGNGGSTNTRHHQQQHSQQQQLQQQQQQHSQMSGVWGSPLYAGAANNSVCLSIINNLCQGLGVSREHITVAHLLSPAAALRLPFLRHYSFRRLRLRFRKVTSQILFMDGAALSSALGGLFVFVFPLIFLRLFSPALAHPAPHEPDDCCATRGPQRPLRRRLGVCAPAGRPQLFCALHGRGAVPAAPAAATVPCWRRWGRAAGVAR